MLRLPKAGAAFPKSRTNPQARACSDSRAPQDRPDLIESELSGLAFDSNHQLFKTAQIEVMFTQDPPIPVINEPVYLFIDPAAGGPQSDYAMLSVTRQKGMLTVCCPALLMLPELHA